MLASLHAAILAFFTEQQSTSVLTAKVLYYMFMVGVFTTWNYHLVLRHLPLYKKWIGTGHNKWIWYLHGTLTFSVMWLAQPRNLGKVIGAVVPESGIQLGTSTWGLSLNRLEVIEISQYFLFASLMFVLWDFCFYHKMHRGISQILLNCHHGGLFLVVMFGQGWDVRIMVGDKQNASDLDALADQTFLHTCCFGWLWAIHSFGLFLEILKFVTGRKEFKEGERSYAVDFLKHLYACVTVWFYYKFLNLNAQVFWTSEVTSLLIMMLGRMFIGSNWKLVDFLRRIEIPGLIICLVDRVFGIGLIYAAGIYLSLLFALFIHGVFFKKFEPKPNEYIAPKSGRNEELRQFLEAETDRVLGKQVGNDAELSFTAEEQKAALEKWQGMRKHCVPWFSGQSSVADEEMKNPDAEEKSWTELFPMHWAVVSQMVEGQEMEDSKGKQITHTPHEVQSLLDKHGAKLANASHTKWYNGTALSWCGVIGYPYEAALILLKEGADPYIKGDDGKDALDGAMHNQFKMSCGDVPGSLGYSKGFWVRFNELCLKASPAGPEDGRWKKAKRVVAGW